MFLILRELKLGNKYDRLDREDGSRQAVAESMHKAERERELTGDGWTFKTLEPSSTPPPTRPRPLILPKKSHQLGTKYPNLNLWGPLVNHSNTTDSGSLSH